MDFCKAAGTYTEYERTFVAGYDRHFAGKTGAVTRKQNAFKNAQVTLTNDGNGGIIQTDIPNDIKAEKSMSDIHSVGKINREIFKVVTDDIQTDEVIITNTQIEHIKERHPNDYEVFYNSIRTTIENPEYIFQSDEPNSALVMNSVDHNGKSLVIVLRLKVSTDPDDYKNSIITLMGLSEKKRKKYIRNKKVLYKRE